VSDSKFILVGRLVEYEKYYRQEAPSEPEYLVKSDTPSDQRFYAIFVVVAGDPEKGGIHEVVAAPSAANSAYACIRAGVFGLVIGNIKSFRGKAILLATFITSFTPNNIVAQEYFPDVKEWSVPVPQMRVMPGTEPVSEMPWVGINAYPAPEARHQGIAGVAKLVGKRSGSNEPGS